MVDFSDHFWGEKNNGFAVLYQNMKHEQVSVSEFSDFLKQGLLTEEEHQKHVLKVLKQVSLYGALGSFAPIWQLVKATLERASQIQTQFTQKFHEMLKDVLKYTEEQRQAHKSVKDRERVTYDSVNSMQTTTTLLQKAKEMYTLRCVDVEKLRRDNAAAKDITRAEVKAKKAGDEYRLLVEKYAKVRTDFEKNMTASSRSFQEIEEGHLVKMKSFVVQYAIALESAYQLMFEVAAEFKHKVEYMKIVDLLGDFITKSSTGKEKPGVINFEEPDITSLFPPAPQSTPPTVPASTSVMPDDLLWPMDTPADLSGGSSTLSAATEAAKTELPTPTSEQDGEASTATSVAPPKKLPLFGSWTKRKSQPAAKTSLSAPSGAKPTTPNAETLMDGFLRTPDEEAPTRSEGFFKAKNKKDKKRASAGEREQNSSEKAPKDAGAEGSDDDSELDEEGYKRVPNATRNANEVNKFYSSSEDESDDDGQKKINVTIKPKESASVASASVDDLLKAVNQMAAADPWKSPNSAVAKSQTAQNLNSLSMSFFDPIGAEPNATAAWPVQTVEAPAAVTKTNTRNLLRPSYTGDGLPASSKLTRNLTQISEDHDLNFANAPPLPERAPPSMHGRQRPRSNTPTAMLNLAAPLQARRSSASSATARANMSLPAPLTGTGAMVRTDSLGSLNDYTSQVSSGQSVGSRGPSPVTIGFSDVVPIAVGVTETLHAMFKGSDELQCKMKAFGMVAVSFPAGVVQMLTTNPQPAVLAFQVTNLAKVGSEVRPNIQLLNENSSARSETSRVFEFNMNALCAHLKSLVESSSSLQFFNVTVLHYEIQLAPSLQTLPLHLMNYWKCEQEHTDIRVDYRYNQLSPLTSPLLNLSFAAVVDGQVKDVQSQPQSVWSAETNTLVWKLTELSRHGESAGSLKARLALKEGPSTATSVAASFQINDATLSGADVQLAGTGYRISLLKKKVVTGKYLCEPERR